MNSLTDLSTLLKMMYSGVITALIYDTATYIFYTIMNKRKISDLIFVITSFYIFIMALKSATNFKLRLFHGIGIISGWLIYFLFISWLVIYLMKKIHLFFSFIYKSIAKPLRHTLNSKGVKNVKEKLKYIINIPNDVKLVYNKHQRHFLRKGGSSNEPSKIKEKKKN